MTDVAAHLATNLRALRKSRGMTQAQISELAGVPRPTWAVLEAGRGNPTLDVLTKVAAGLDVSVEDLIRDPRRRAPQLVPARGARGGRDGQTEDLLAANLRVLSKVSALLERFEDERRSESEPRLTKRARRR